MGLSLPDCMNVSPDYEAEKSALMFKDRATVSPVAHIATLPVALD
jgi:hypothetical protein